MVITQTPFRMSLFGGGTDMPDFFRQYGGAVISTTFDKYCYVTVRHLPRFFDWKTHISYAQSEYVNTYDEIRHPLVRNAMSMLDMHELRLIYDADLPARSGLGTSSSFAVGMINAFHCLKGQYVNKKKLADEAIYVERTLCNEAGGWQDQIAASYGGLNRIDFRDNDYEVKPIVINPEKKAQLNNNLLLFFSGFTRFSAEIQEANRISGKAESDRITKLKEILELVDEAERVLIDKNQDLDRIGELLDTTWRLKRGTGNAVSTDTIDTLYNRGIKAGALGGKLLGAGGGGFLLFYVQPERQIDVRKAMKDLLYIPFKFENAGSRVVHYEPEDYNQ